MGTASSAISTWRASRSASEKTATVAIPKRRAVLMTRQAISPRLAIRIRLNMPPDPAKAILGFAAQQRKCQHAGAAGEQRKGGRRRMVNLHQRARASRAADVARDPSQDVGVDVLRLAHARPGAGKQQPFAYPHKDGRLLDRCNQRI